MLYSIACILLFGMLTGHICNKLKLPGLLGMLFTGIVLGPKVFNLIDESILVISPQLRKVALIIILTRAGLTLDLKDLKQVGRPAFLLCFLPATFEIVGMVIIAPFLLGVSYLEAAIIGTVVAAVSPAVIVPKMLKLMEKGIGVKKKIPQMILAGASVDDVFVIVLFTVFTGIAKGRQVSLLSLLNIPISIVLGMLIGTLSGYLMSCLFRRVHIRDSEKVMIFLSIAFLLVTAEDFITTPINFSSLIAVMAAGIAILKYRAPVAKRLAQKFNKLWVCAEIILFVLVGASTDFTYLTREGYRVFLLLLLTLVFRMAGVYLCLLQTKLLQRERIFCMVAYMPKATVQAAIGGIPLSMGLACGPIVLTVAVCAIIITAPLGAFLIDRMYKTYLE